ncbi:InlB B-repeat-containing protein [Blautia wexlerae]|jgi:uncharacterized repeat protein (TIGR02543 family)|uniref:InlB B-repeat-containing protein n=1 Tax=Blautia wexlerae TaxID=418240 RepID=UPI00321B08D6
MKGKKFLGIVLAVTMMFTGNVGTSAVIQGAEFGDGGDVNGYVEETIGESENINESELDSDNIELVGENSDEMFSDSEIPNAEETFEDGAEDAQAGFEDENEEAPEVADVWEELQGYSAEVSYGISGPRIVPDSTLQSGMRVTYDCVWLGRYQRENANKNNPLKWRVLAVNGTDAFLWCEDEVADVNYHNTADDFTWETCDLRKWLNGEFYKNAFNATEKAAIRQYGVENLENPLTGTYAGRATLDYIYLLSVDEVINPRYGFSTNPSIQDDARKRKGRNCWWLRTPGTKMYLCGMFMGGGEGIVYNGSGVVYKPGGLPYYPDSVYPVLHLNLANEKAYTYAGTVCTNGTVNEQNKPNSGTVEDNSKYEITFDKNANNAVVDFSSKVVTKGDKYGKLPEARRNNYVFAGWYTKKKGGTKVTSDTVVKISKNQRLYAQWRLGGYIIYDLNEGTNAKANPSYYYSTNGVKLEAPKRKGYIFKGWYTTKDFSTGTKISKIKVGTRGDKVLYARWGAKKNQEIQIEKQITKTYKDIGKEFKLSISGRQENAKVTYASSNKKVATAKDGKILIKGVGKATITVNFAETTNYNAAKKKMEVIVLDEQTIQINARFETGTGFPALAIGIMNEIHYTSEKILLNATAEGNKLSYTSSDKKIAVVDKNGGIQCKSTGIVTITITAKQTEKYAKATQRVTFKIAKGKPVINCPKEINKNVFDAPFNLGANTGAEKVTLSYESNAPEATVDKEGKVTLHNWEDNAISKEVQITIISKATRNYESATATITLKISKLPPDEIYLKQPQGSKTCTLYATMMMLRRKAWLNNDKNWRDIIEKNVKPYAWDRQNDWLRGSFTYAGMTTWYGFLPDNVEEKKKILISMLKDHPEGIMIYANEINPSHAVLLTDYTEGVFYCADSDPGQKSGRILLTETLIAETCGSQDQDVVINSLKKYWYIK